MTIRTSIVGLFGLVGLLGCTPTSGSGVDHLRYIVQVDGPSAEFGSGLEDALGRARWLAADGAGPTLTGQIRYETSMTVDGTPVLHVLMAVEPDARLARELDAIDDTLDTLVEVERRDQTIEPRRDLPFAVMRAVGLLDAKIVGARGVPSEVESLIRTADPEVVLIALHAAERRKLRGVADTVVTVLEHSDPRVAMRAIECLGVIGEPSHTPALIRATRIADRGASFRLYEALAAIGGEHALGFLEFAVRNEDDPEQTRWAARALEQVRARAPERVVAATMSRGHRQ